MLQSQHNAWIHALATVSVIGAGMFYQIGRSDWNWIVTAIMSVWIAEAFNTAFEFLADVTNPAFHPLVEKSKDVAAGAVLIAAIGSVTIGLLVFGPFILGTAK
jgi:diacylglycerol kinase (ATP)